MKSTWYARLTIGILALLLLVANSAVALESTQNLFFSVPPSKVEVGERFTLAVKVRANEQSINAISGAITFSESMLRVVSLSKNKSIINLWTRDPIASRNKVSFEGIILNPGFQGTNGVIFNITFEAVRPGTALVKFSEGAILANDGRGTNVLAKLGSTNVKIIQGQTFSQYQTVALTDVIPPSPSLPGLAALPALPVITEYSPLVDSTGKAYLRGRGEPNALTKIVFKDISLKSLGERFLASLQTKKKSLDEVLVKNDESGAFNYVSPVNLVAGVYNATPFLVDTNANTEKPGLGVQLLVNDSKIVKILVVFINILGLLIPIVGLGVIIYFIPWYSWKRMRVINKKLGLEEEKIDISGRELERQDKVMERTVEKL